MFYNNKFYDELPTIYFCILCIIILCSITPYYYNIDNKYLNYINKFFIIIFIFLLYFYRDPIDNGIQPNFPDNYVIAPSFGTIAKIITNVHLDTIHLCITLNLLDVHQQYYPVNGYIHKRQYDASGQFELAYTLHKSRYNEKKMHFIRNKYGQFIVTQIAGKFIRRITSDDSIDVCVKASQRFGMIAFGSRVDIEIPNAKSFVLKVKEGTKIIGGQQILGYYTQ